ncbi:MAG: tetrahydrofolate dehydrogenase/cyclohydrolase catalytic domain-containing protein, partial [Bellilinea sp.]
MTAEIIDGKAIAEDIRAKVKVSVAERLAAGKPVPGLATVLVGDNPASQVYVRSKRKACEEAGIQSFGVELPATATQAEVEGAVRELNQDSRVNGILVQ